MRASRNKKAIGLALIALAIGMLTNFWLAVLSLGSVFFFWGHRPAKFYAGVEAVPWGTKLRRWFESLDDWIEGEDSDTASPEVIYTLRSLHREGEELMRGSSPSAGEQKSSTEWEGDVLAYLEEHLPGEKFGFETSDDEKKTPADKIDMPSKLQKLHAIIMRQEGQ